MGHTLRGRDDAAALVGEAECPSDLEEHLTTKALPPDQITQAEFCFDAALPRAQPGSQPKKREVLERFEELRRAL